MRVEVYRNLHKGCYSIRHRGKVIGHAASVQIDDAQLVVQKAGQKRTRETGQKCVHAFVRGTLKDTSSTDIHSPEDSEPLKYNPHKMDTFQTFEGCPVHKAEQVFLGPRSFEAVNPH